jgi:hypothetical protein
MRKKTLGFIILIIILGALIGSALGEIIAFILPVGVVKEFFLKSATASIGPGTLNIIILTITLGFSFKINVIGILGVVIAAYLLRWID